MASILQLRIQDCRTTSVSSVDIQNRAATIQLMLEYGAGKGIRRSGPEGAYSVSSIAKMFMAEAPAETEKIKSLLNEKFSVPKGVERKSTLVK